MFVKLNVWSYLFVKIKIHFETIQERNVVAHGDRWRIAFHFENVNFRFYTCRLNISYSYHRVQAVKNCQRPP